MTRTIRFVVGLSLLSLVLAGVSWAQSDLQKGKGGGPSGLYDTQTVVTVSGIVIAKTPPSGYEGLPMLVYLTVKTEAGKITVFMGPDLYVDKMPVKINKLDRIQVTGSQVNWEGKPLIVAAEIKKGDQVLKLREPNGVPVWTGRGRN
jgi:hypothetical protein